MSSTGVAAAARRLIQARSSGLPCSPVRDLIGPQDLDAAYAVQREVVAARLEAGATVVGRKIGATSTAVQRQLGVDQPDFGYLLDDMDVSGLAVVPWAELVQPRVEAEVAFVLGADLAGGPITDEQVRESIDHFVGAIEIVDSRIEGWDISFADTVADNASSGLFALGTERRTLSDLEPRDVAMTLSVDGVVASTGSGTDCLGDPLRAVAWLAERARAFGDPLRAGQVVLSGALGPFVPVHRGSSVSATISGLGRIDLQF